jgi:hypothetical protein
MNGEDVRRDIQETRRAHSAMASALILGEHYSETITVRFVDRQEHEIRVYALSTADVQAAFEAVGADLKDIGNREKISSNLKLMGEITRRATHNTDICDKLWPLEDSKIAAKALEISGLTESKNSPKVD